MSICKNVSAKGLLAPGSQAKIRSGMNVVRARRVLTVAFAVALAAMLQAAGQREPSKNDRPSLSLRVTPQTALAPARISGNVELKGGSDSFEEYYCVTVEWDWADGAISQSTADCDPYEAGKTEIRRRYTAEHAYQSSGSYRVAFKLKKKDKVLATATAIVQITGGDRFGY